MLCTFRWKPCVSKLWKTSQIEDMIVLLVNTVTVLSACVCVYVAMIPDKGYADMTKPVCRLLLYVCVTVT